MTFFTTRGSLRQTVRLALAGTAILAAVQGASADDAGVHQFFAAIFGGGAVEPAAPAPRPSALPSVERIRRYKARPLTVRLHRPKPVMVAQDVPTKPGKVSIFEDRTLRRGDAVMTGKGIRVFAGSTSWPYAASDFVALDDARQLNKDTSKTLAQLDRLPRG